MPTLYTCQECGAAYGLGPEAAPSPSPCCGADPGTPLGEIDDTLDEEQQLAQACAMLLHALFRLP